MNSKLREALELCDKIMSDVVVGARAISPLEAFDEMSGIINKALSAPPMNCDVGTADEQDERFILFCRRNSFRGVCNDSCKFANVNRRLGCQKIGQSRCFAFWAQMPYEGGVK